MKPFYNTPSPCNFNVPAPKILSKKEQLYKLEDQYSYYREDCNKGYCELDKKVVEKFTSDIAKLTEELKNNP